jgi:CRISPR system Cascade subunit CasD
MPSSSEPISELQPMSFLLFRLWGPMAAWGDITVGERRTTWNRPSRSAMLGLVAGSLGIERTNRTAHDELEAGLGFAVRVDEPGRPLRDYHTAQSPSRALNKRWHTRRDELDAPSHELNTILSERSYFTEMDAIIVLWRRPGTPGPALPDIAARLVEPVFLPFLGRKSCPLGAPLKPIAIEAAEPLAALIAYDAHVADGHLMLTTGPKRRRQPTLEFWMDEDDVRTFRLTTPVIERKSRRDGIRDRSRWQFSDRAEVCLHVRSAA